jgi:hypothetical protein
MTGRLDLADDICVRLCGAFAGLWRAGAFGLLGDLRGLSFSRIGPGQGRPARWVTGS